MQTAAQAFVAARDFLLRVRSDQAAAHAQFSWPRPETFNWALDYFDPMARGNATLALCIVEEDGMRRRISYLGSNPRKTSF